MTTPLRLYKEHRVFNHLATKAAIYVCFERLADGKFCVQQMEFFVGGSFETLASRSNEIAVNTLELFVETAPSERCEWFSSLEAAIEAHNEEFQSS